MTNPYKKKLIEVAIPLEAINMASAREKSIRHGHPSTLHLWWARRPLAACRAVLFAQLVDDPSSLPEQFPTAESQDAERKRLFAIIEELVIWENSTNEEVLERARTEIRRSCDGVLPPVYDPFSGGGSIPLEAQRLGLPAYGSDLNPVAVMIGKAMIEIPPKFKDMSPIHPGPKDRQFYRNAEGLAEDVKYYGEWMRAKAWERIGHLYPQVDLPKHYGGGKSNVIAWFWARTVTCVNPGCRCETPLLSSFVLSSKKGNEAYLTPVVEGRSVRFEVGDTFKLKGRKPEEGYKRGKSAIFECAFCGTPTDRDYVAAEGLAGRIGAIQTAVACEGNRSRIYLTADYALLPQNIPDVDLPALDFEFQPNPRDVWCRNFGLLRPRDLFTRRQLATLSVFQDLVLSARSAVEQDSRSLGLADDKIGLNEMGRGAQAYGEAVSVYLTFALDRAADAWSSQVTWRSSVQASRSTFARQALPMTWDYVELNPFSESNGNWTDASIEWVYKSLSAFAPASEGEIRQGDAQTVVYPGKSVISSDPPYYDNIGYADLADFFFAWMKPALKSVYPNLFGILATPKTEELVAAPYRQGGASAAEDFFLNGMKDAIRNMRENTHPAFPAAIYYAFKQSEVEAEGISSTGWATFIQAVVEAGYAVVGTWPMRTEKPGRMVSVGTNALANSVVLVCRKKEAAAATITRAEFIRALKRELPPSIAELQAANIAPADMPQSAIGPGMGVFSRYKAVLESDDSPMSVKVALQLINRELDEYLGGIQGEFDADTRFAITWFEQNGLKAGDYGTANSIATARGISVESVKHAGIVESQAGKVRVLRRDELDDNWEPGTDQHLTIWECLQHLVRLHEKDGISHATAVLLKKIGDKAEAVKDLAYILYDISANKRQDAKEATAYNALIADWTELSRQAASNLDTRGNLQQRLDF
jgi:putative DNA methylase